MPDDNCLNQIVCGFVCTILILCGYCFIRLLDKNGKPHLPVMKTIIFIYYFAILFAVVFIREQGATAFCGDVFRMIRGIYGVFCYEIGIQKKLGAYYKACEYLREGILNILMFVPMGFILSDGIKNVHRCIFIGASGSLFIEVLQILTAKGTFDLGDLLHNTLGTVLGVFLFRKIIS